jgi:F0F1-type ATP synthase assembly protein I
MDDATPRPDPESGASSRPEPPHQPTVAAAAVEFLSLGLAAAVAILAAGAAGYFLDRWLGTSPIFVLIGVALGLAAAISMTVARVRKYL